LDGQRTPLQDFETLYIGGAELAVIRRTSRWLPLRKAARW
jgi:hypothetical protein